MSNQIEWQTGKPTLEGPYAVVELIKHGDIVLRNVGFAIYSHVGKRNPFFWRKDYKTHKRVNLNNKVCYWIPLPTLPKDFPSETQNK